MTTAAEIPVNTTTSGPQTRPDVAFDAAGNSVVVWESYLQDGAGWGIFGQRFDAAGAPAGSEFQVNSVTAGDQRYAAVAMAPDGVFMVVWLGADASGNGIRGRRFTSAGAPTGAEFVVNTTTSGSQTEPDVAIDGTGAALVVWQSDHTGNLEIRGRTYDAAGTAAGNEVALNSTTADDQQLPSVAGSAGGGFVVVWQGYGQDGPAQGIIARRFASSGSPLGAEVVANGWTSGDQVSPDVGQAADGSFVVAWEDTTNQDGMGSSIRARRFSSAGVPLSGDVQVNTYWMDDQTRPRVAADSSGMVTSRLGERGSGRLQSRDLLEVHQRQRSPDLTGDPIQQSCGRHPISAGGGQIRHRRLLGHLGQRRSGRLGDGIFGVFGAAPVITEIFTDGFESGDTSGWGATSP